MAEEKLSSTALLQVPGTKTTYYVKVDAVADTYSVIKATNEEFQNNEGTTLFQIKSATSLTSYTDIPEANQGEGWDADLGDACEYDTAGWYDSTPACGGSARYIDDNDDCRYEWTWWFDSGCYVDEGHLDYKDQECR